MSYSGFFFKKFSSIIIIMVIFDYFRRSKVKGPGNNMLGVREMKDGKVRVSVHI